MDEQQPRLIIEFEQAGGARVALAADTIEALVELDDGICQLVSGTDVYRVRIGYDEVRDRIWPKEEA